MSKNILIVEDEPKLAELLVDYLAYDGFSSHCLADGLGVIDWVKKHSPDLILMDVMLPHRDGMSLCQEIRQFSSVPLFLITARVAESDRLRGLNIGADDYICKPYSPKEVVARIKAFFRRQSGFTENLPAIAGFMLEKERFQASYEGHPLELTPSEFRVLSVLLNKVGQVYSRATLLDCLNEDDRDVLDRAVDTHIKNLRRKIQEVLGRKEVIVSVYGLGYKINSL